jgi:hypothetical protein
LLFAAASYFAVAMTMSLLQGVFETIEKSPELVEAHDASAQFSLRMKEQTVGAFSAKIRQKSGTGSGIVDLIVDDCLLEVKIDDVPVNPATYG